MLSGDRWILFLATGCGTGNIPVAPGTFGSLIGLVLAWGVAGFASFYWVAFTLIFCGLAVWVAHRAENLMGSKDPGAIVIDEMAGMLVACAWLPLTVFSAVVLFVLFRLFDIIKPFPVGWVDRHFSGGLGIVADDLVAGILANLAYRAGSLLVASV